MMSLMITMIMMMVSVRVQARKRVYSKRGKSEGRADLREIKKG